VFFDANRDGVPDFLDRNGNGLQDAGEPDEPSALSSPGGHFNFMIPAVFDANGDGLLELDEGRLVAQGGTIIDTGLPLQMTLTAPPGSGVIPPLTTLMVGLMDQQGWSWDVADVRLAEALGLPAIDLTQFDPIAQTAHGNLDAVPVAAAAEELYDAEVQIATL